MVDSTPYWPPLAPIGLNYPLSVLTCCLYVKILIYQDHQIRTSRRDFIIDGGSSLEIDCCPRLLSRHLSRSPIPHSCTSTEERLKGARPL